MSDIPNLTQFFGGGPTATVLDDGTTDTSPQTDDDGYPLDFSIPSAWQNPDLWDSVLLTDSTNPDNKFLLPPPGMGTVKMKTPLKTKIDAKGGAGKAKPKVTKTGGDATKDKIKFEAIDEAWPYFLAASRAMSPGTGPWNISHPTMTIAKIGQIEIETWTNAPEQDAHGMITWEIGYVSIDPNAQTGNGGGSATSTPDAADGQRSTVSNFGGIPGNTVTFNTGSQYSSGPAPKQVNPNSAGNTSAQNNQTKA